MAVSYFDCERFWSPSFDNMGDFVFLVDSRSVIRKVNISFLQFTGKTLDGVVGKNCREIIHSMDKATDNCLHAGLSENREFISSEIYDSFLNRWFLMSVTPIFGDNGGLIGSINIARDITPKKEMELELERINKELTEKNDQLEKLNQVKSDFVSNVSHELRTPLTPIREGVSLMLDGVLGRPNEKQVRALTIALRNIDRLTRLINNLLDTSKIEAGKFTIDKTRVNIVDLIESVIATFALQVKSKGLVFKTEYDGDALEAYVDRDRTTQVLTNLVNNAVKFTERGGITISLREKDRYLECAVRDTGPGISKEGMDVLFNKFQQVGRISTLDGGTGLGLVISKGIVEIQGGEIRAESEPGRGTSFIFTMPKYSESDIICSAIVDAIAVSQEKNRFFSLLLVKIDDYGEIVTVLGQDKAEDILKGIGHSLEEAITGLKYIGHKENGQIVIVAELDRQSSALFNNIVRRAIKSFLLDFCRDFSVTFSYSWAYFPEHGTSARELMDAAAVNLISEKSQRLEANILIADDEPAVVNALRQILRGSGYTNFITSGDGEEVLQNIKKVKPDLLILDMKMPKLSGYEVVGRLKENVATKDIPILIMSGYEVETPRLEEYIRTKAIPIVGKPFNAEQIVRIVDYLL